MVIISIYLCMMDIMTFTNLHCYVGGISVEGIGIMNGFPSAYEGHNTGLSGDQVIKEMNIVLWF